MFRFIQKFAIKLSNWNNFKITHGFDDSGSQFDERGNLNNWWDPSTEDRFKNLTKCIIDQYGGYEVESTDLKINGNFIKC